MIGEPAGAFYPLSKAATLLGVSVVTLRRRIKADAVQARQVDTRHGRAWEVWVDQASRVHILPAGHDQADPDQEDGSAQPAAHSSRSDQALLKALELLDQMLADNRALRGQLAATEDRIRALTAGDAHETHTEGQQAAPLREVGVAQVRALPRRSWWAFWR